jgi:hypothetical protein
MPDMDNSDSNILARIDERTQAQSTTLAAHVKDDTEKFDKIFNFVSKRFDKIDAKLDTLWDEKNQRKGAFSASKLLTGGLWAAIVLAASYFIPLHKS